MKTVSKFAVALAAAALASPWALAGAAEAAERPSVVMGTPENSFNFSLLKGGRLEGPKTPIAKGDLLGPMMRATVFSRDRSRQIILYKDILGLNPMTDVYIRGLAINRVKGTEGLEQHATIWMAGSSGEGNVGIYQLYRETFAFPPIDTSPAIKTGDYAMTFTTSDVAKVLEGVNKVGFTIITPPTVQGADTPFPGATKLTIRGPDGVIVNFIQPPK